MALSLEELYGDRDVREFWKETGVFSEAIPRVCGHVETLIQRYGALFGLVVWLGTDGKLYMVSSRNLGLAFRLIPLELLKQGLRPYIAEILGRRPRWVDFHKLKNIYGRGSQDERGNSKGYHNKKAAFSLQQKRLEDSGALPVLAVVYANNRYLSLCHPNKDTGMQNLMEKVVRYYQTLSKDGVTQIRPNLSFLPPSLHVASSQRRTKKQEQKDKRSMPPGDAWEVIDCNKPSNSGAASRRPPDESKPKKILVRRPGKRKATKVALK